MIGGLVGMGRQMRRRADPIGVWNAITLGAVVGVMLVLVIGGGFYILMLMAFAQSGWQF